MYFYDTAGTYWTAFCERKRKIEAGKAKAKAKKEILGTREPNKGDQYTLSKIERFKINEKDDSIRVFRINLLSNRPTINFDLNSILNQLQIGNDKNDNKYFSNEIQQDINDLINVFNKNRTNITLSNIFIIYCKPDTYIILKDKNWEKRLNWVKLRDIHKKRYQFLFSNKMGIRIDKFKIGSGMFTPSRDVGIRNLATTEWTKRDRLRALVNCGTLEVLINITKEFDDLQEKLRDHFIKASKYSMNCTHITNLKNNWDFRQYFLHGDKSWYNQEKNKIFLQCSVHLDSIQHAKPFVV